MIRCDDALAVVYIYAMRALNSVGIVIFLIVWEVVVGVVLFKECVWVRSEVADGA